MYWNYINHVVRSTFVIIIIIIIIMLLKRLEAAITGIAFCDEWSLVLW